MATKFSALPLFLPLAVAALPALASRAAALGRALRGWLLAVVGCALAAFAVGAALRAPRLPEPSCHDVLEQSPMVRQRRAASPTPTSTSASPKYVLRPRAAGAVGHGAAARPGRRVGDRGALSAWRARTLRAEDWILLAWVVPFFLITGWFDVKFSATCCRSTRCMILWAAAWLVRGARSARALGRVRAWTVVAGTAALPRSPSSSIYTRPHTVVTASEWIYRHVPPGSKILTQHWDEGFPLPLPGRQRRRATRSSTSPTTSPTTPAKMRRSGQRAGATSDYIAFQTKRLYGAVTRAPAKFPLTNNYFYLLFAGDLGYTLVYDVRLAARPVRHRVPRRAGRRIVHGLRPPEGAHLPRTPGISTADEICRQDHAGHAVAAADAHRPAARARRRRPARTTRPPATADPLEPGSRCSGSSLVVELLGLSAFAVLAPLAAGARASTRSARSLGVLLFAYVPWLLDQPRQAGFTQRHARRHALVAHGVVGVARLAPRRARRAAARRDGRRPRLLFWGAFAFFLAVRAFNPEIFWGEKPMDFSFLNALTRSHARCRRRSRGSRARRCTTPTSATTSSPRSARCCTIHPAITFNLGIALFGGLTAAGALRRRLRHRRAAGGVGAAGGAASSS